MNSSTSNDAATTWALTSLAPPPPPPPKHPRLHAHHAHAQPKWPTSESPLEYTPLAAIPTLRKYAKVNILAVIQAESNPIPSLNRNNQAQIKLCLRDNSLPRSAPYTTLMLFRHQLQDFSHSTSHLLAEGTIIRIKSASVTFMPNKSLPMLIVGSNDDNVTMSVTPSTLSSHELEAVPIGISGISPLQLGAGDHVKVNALREWWWSQTHAANLTGFSQVGLTQVSPPQQQYPQAAAPPMGPPPIFHPPTIHTHQQQQHAPPPLFHPPPPPAAAPQSAPAPPPTLSPRPIHPSIATTQIDHFYDLILEIVEVKGYYGDTFMTALVTDYSSKSLPEIGTFQHTFGAGAPVTHDHQGVLLDPHTLIPMVLFDEHKHFATEHFKAGTLILVRNCRAAMAMSGSMARFELKMQGARGRWLGAAGVGGLPRIEVVSREDERCRALMQRRSRMLEVQNLHVVTEQIADRMHVEGVPEIGTEGVEAKRRRVGEVMVSNGVAGSVSVPMGGPVPASFTYIKHPYIPTVSLADIINSPTPNGKYRCRVRFTKVLPQKLVNCTRRMCRACMLMLKQADQVCPKCASATHTSFAFCMVFTLVDELGDTLDVLVNEPSTLTPNPARLKLFPGLVPTDLSTDQITSRSLLARLAYVLFGMPAVPADIEAKVLAGQATIASIGLVRPEGLRPPVDQVWCDVCIESYLAPPATAAAAEGGETAGGAVAERQVKYRLFDTEMREPGSGGS